MHCNHLPTPGLSKIFELGMDRANVFLSLERDCMAAETVDLAAGDRKMLAVLALGPREGRGGSASCGLRWLKSSERHWAR